MIDIKKPPTMTLYGGLGYCKLVKVFGEDADIAKSARTSYDNYDEVREPADDAKLIHYLHRHRHTSPFEQCSLTYQLKMPLFVMRQFVRHRTFRLNEFSARYKEVPEEFYIPKVWREQDDKNKQGSKAGKKINQDLATGDAKRACEMAFQSYRDLLNNGVAREQARCVLPVNMMTVIVVNIDLHNLMHFLRLRTDSHAQEEIQHIANAMQVYFRQAFPVAHEAYVRYTVQVKDRNEQ